MKREQGKEAPYVTTSPSRSPPPGPPVDFGSAGRRTGPGSLDTRLAMRPAEASDALGISPRTLRRWMRDLGLPYVRVDRVVLIPVGGLQNWLQERSAEERKTDRLVGDILNGL